MSGIKREILSSCRIAQYKKTDRPTSSRPVSYIRLLELQLLCRKEEKGRKKQVAESEQKRYLFTHWAVKPGNLLLQGCCAGSLKVVKLTEEKCISDYKNTSLNPCSLKHGLVENEIISWGECQYALVMVTCSSQGICCR